MAGKPPTILARTTGLSGVALVVLLCAGCSPSPLLRAVREPRGGTPVGNGVCVVYSQHYQIDLGGLERLHPFDINKYAKIYLQLVNDGMLRPEQVYVPGPVSREDLLRVHTAAYLRHLRNPAMLARYLESAPLALCAPGLADAGILLPFRYATGGTIEAARLALTHGKSINLAGGYHHAEPDRGGGFCIYADMPIAIRILQAERRIRRALVVDVDVHQGNGTARCIAADPDVYTFDMHEDDIYPIPKEHNDLDVPLSAGMGDAEYLQVLGDYLPRVFDAARPEIVFLQAGVDSLAGDPLARLELTEAGIVRRDAMVFEAAARRHVPIVMVLGGGYSKQAWHAQYLSVRNLLRVDAQARPGRMVR